jgi:hypothetical protein
MTRAEFDALCAAHPGATLSGPGELDAWKVGGKMFACFGHEEERAANTEHVAVKTRRQRTAAMLIDAGAATRRPISAAPGCGSISTASTRRGPPPRGRQLRPSRASCPSALQATLGAG